MPNKRRTVQEAHERFTVGEFLDAFNRRYHSKFKVIEEPNPPEAIIQSGRTIRWVEVTTAYWNKAFAIDLNSYVTEGEVHKPIGDGVFVEPDKEFAHNFVAAIGKKLEKKSYEKFRNCYGPGYLVVSVQYPLFGAHSIRYMTKSWSSLSVVDQNCFRSIYVMHRVLNGYRVFLWNPQ